MNDDAFRFCQADDSCPDPDPHPDPETPSSRPDSATTPEEGQLGTVTLDELFYLLSNGALGVEPKRHHEMTRTSHAPPEAPSIK